MQQPGDVLALLGSYGSRVDAEARTFLERGPYAMYGMMRYFMGYADENLVSVAECFGGKRFRSGLLLLIADQYGALEDAVPLALSIELFHNFTLIHDDIVDRDEMRRGRPTVWKLWGSDHAINTGDGQLLLALEALERAHPARRDRARPFFLEKYREVIEGQYLDFELTAYSLNDPRTTEAAYLEMLTKKTSVLVGAATAGAGIAALMRDEELERLWNFGLALGRAYQICDDTVSIWGSGDMTGKVPHGDVRERKKTLPVLIAYERLTGTSRDEFAHLYGSKKSLSADEIQRAIALMNSVDAYGAARARVDREAGYARQAADSLAIPEVGKELLGSLVTTLLPRVTV
ncbi:polyprenyl synthetase family protein [Patescibacteria group bacterium]|nr:polyprenyl synthetase family protein [Patescibacteria group bacterium]